MVVKKYIKRDGKFFGPYYYESKRINGKVCKIYIGGEKEYRTWKYEREKSYYTLKNGYKKYLFFIFICLISIFLIINLFSFSNEFVKYRVTGFVISENKTEGEMILDVKEESVTKQFSSDKADLFIKEPATSMGEPIGENKNKIIDFNLSGKNF